MPSSEQSAFAVDFADDGIRANDTDEPDGTLQEAGGRTHTQIVGIGVRPINVCIHYLCDRIQGTRVLGNIVEQAEIRVEDLAHIHDEQNDDHGADVGQGHESDLLPLGGSKRVNS